MALKSSEHEDREKPSAPRSQPSWVVAELPKQYGEIARQIEELKAEARKYEQYADVLWQTGRPLVEAVRDIFAALQFEAQVMNGEATYDVVVDVDGGRRLLLEVVGGPEAIGKKSPQIAKVLQAIQDDAGAKDRVVMVANAFCGTPPASRRQEPAEPEALRLIQGLGANLVATTTLFGLWRYSLEDLDGARRSVGKLHELDGGVFR